MKRILATATLAAAVLTVLQPMAWAKAKKDTGAGKPIVIEGDRKPIGNPNAPQGGTFNFNLEGEPPTIHPIQATDLYAINVLKWTCEGLLDRDPDTNEWIPGIADRAEISADGLQFTFHLRSGAKWHDGQPVTAEDVKFSFDMIFEPKYEAAHMRPYYESIEKAEVIDPQTVRFISKEKYFGTLTQLAGLTLLPKHVYGDVDKSKKMNKTVICSGPYKIEKFDQGQSITVVRNKEWWGNSVSHHKGEYNFERIRFRFINSEDIALEMLKKGDVDFYEVRPDAFEKKAVGPEWGKVAIKEKIDNLKPKPYSFVGWNLRKPIFQDVNTRRALAHLFNRDEVIKKYFYGLAKASTGPWNQTSEYADPKVKAIPFDPKAAVELLKKAGWADTDKNGILDKVIDGKKTEFRFTLFYPLKDGEKYWIIFQNDLKKVGIDMQLQLLEWNAFLKAIDGDNFDAFTMGFYPSEVDVDPKQIWHSTSAVKGGSNRPGYKNPEVDKMIDEGRAELNKEKRVAIFRKVYAKIAADAPDLFFYDRAYVLYAHTARMKMPKPAYKYDIGYTYWWLEPGK